MADYNIQNAPFSNSNKKRRKGQRQNEEYIKYMEEETSRQIENQKRIEQENINKRQQKQKELDEVFSATNNKSKEYTQEDIKKAVEKIEQKAQKKQSKKKGKNTKSSRAQKKQEAIDAKQYENYLYENHLKDVEAKNNETIENIINSRQNPDFNNFNYTKDDTIYNQTWADVNNQKVNLSLDDFMDSNEIEAVEQLILSNDEKLNDFLIRKTNEGLSYDEMKAVINKGRRTKEINEEQFNMAKNLIDQNKDYINKSSANKRVAGEVVENTAEQLSQEIAQEGIEDVGNQHLKRALSGRNLNALLNLGFAVSDYNEARNSGEGVVKSAVKAGGMFVAGEMLGGWMMPVMLAKQLPTLAVTAVETSQNITRKMNSVSRIQTFGEAQFMDTQQLATMRQAGMEMAKMSQYNLQQAIMGNEAQYMHRL